MSTRWPGGIINGSAPVPTGGGAGDLAPGVWTLDQADQYIATQTWPGTGTPDPQFQYVTALLHGDGTNGGQNNTFLDSSSNNFTITRNGNTTQGSFSPYGDLWSNNFNGSSNLVTSSSQVIPSGSYTLEAWVFVTGTSATQTIFAQGTGTGDSARTFLGIEDNSGAKWAVQIGGTQAISTITPALNTWTHVAMTFNGSTMALYLNGTSIATASSSTNASNTTLQLGKNWGTYWFNGYISNARVSNTVRYTATFTPQTTPFVADANTVFLSCQANRFIDASTNNYALSVQNGLPSVQRFSPFQNLATYTPARVGGSGYFDGSGDYLSLPDNAAFDLGAPSGTTNDFTLEAWIYPVAFNTAAGIMGSFNDGSQTGYRFVLDNTGSLRVNIGSSFSLTSASSTVVLNQWQHIAVTRTSNNVYIYYNGTRVTSGTSSDAADAPSNFLIGRNAVDVDNWYFPGYISNARVLKGTAQYTASTYTVPTAPFTAVSGTSLLTNFTNGAIFDSDATNVLETVGNAQISTSVVKYGTGSMAFDGTGDWLSAPATPQSNLGSGNFTIECWLYRTASGAASDSGIVSRGAPSSTNGFVFGYNSSNLLTFNFNYSGVIVNGTSAVPLNEWAHVAITRVGNTFTLFLNGQVNGTATSSNSQNTNAADVLYVGRSGFSSDRIVTGYIDDLRITVGYARYWYNFQPPTAPFPNYGGVLAPPVQDPLFDYNTLLLNGDGTNGAQNNTFLDSSTNNFTITRNGNTTQGSFSPYGDLWSNYFNGSNAYLTAPDNTNWQIGSTSTYSVEAWVNVGSTSAQSALFGALNRWWLGSNFTDVSGASGKFCFAVFNGSSWQTISSATTVVAGTWYHVAATFNNGTTRLYINGVQEATTTGVATNSASGSLFMGAILNPGYSYGLTGYLSNIRITKGSSLPYTANFTPSTTPLTAVSGTVLLTAQSNRFVDNSSNAYVITASGTPSVQRFSPFNPTAPYSTSVIGGSGYFDGAGDYLSAADNAALQMGSGDFTVEAWVYSTATNAGASIVDKWTSGSNTDSGFLLAMDGSGRLRGIYGSGGSEFIIDSSSTVPRDSWTHVAIVRSGGTFYLYQNGVSVNSRSITGSVNNGQALGIGARASGSGSQPWTGYIAQARIVKGTAVYSGSTYTVPTAPLTAIGGTSLLTNMTNAGIPDLAMQNNLETVGNAQVSTSVVKYGTGSLAFDGSGDVLSTPYNPGFNFSGNFTIECWLYMNSLASTGTVWSQNSGSTFFILHTSVSGSNALGLYIDTLGASPAIQSSTLSTGVWYHVALTRLGSIFTLFLNGNPQGTYSNSGNPTPSSSPSFFIGNNNASNGAPLNGYIDDFRVTNGIARYVQPFTPPTAALQTF